MLEVTDRFKHWMRYRLNDKEYAERIIKAVTENEDCVLTDTWCHAALPECDDPSEDPEALIALLTGHNPKTRKDIVVAILGKWEDVEELIFPYVGIIWGMYHPVTDYDFMKLPEVYEIAFKNSESDEPMTHLGWARKNGDGKEDDFLETLPGFGSHRVNIINTRLDSDLIKLITAEKEN